MGCITEATSGFPNANGHIPFECANIAEVLVEHGWNTYIVGKWHLCAEDEMNLASSKRQWPLGRGFERYYGFLGGETNQWYPDLVYDNHPVPPPATPEEGYHLSADLTDKAIEFVQDAKAIAPDKPFFLYYCPGAAHAPHHAPAEWIEKYRGRFDMGYEAYREGVLERQKSLGIIDPSTELTPIDPYAGTTSHDGKAWPHGDTVLPWDSLTEDEQRLFCRMAEVYAGFLSHADHHSVACSTISRRRASWTTPSSFSSPTTERQARAVPTARSTRTSSSTASPTRWRPTWPSSTSWAAPPRTTTTRPAGPGRSTRRSSCGSATPTSRAARPIR